MYCRLYADDIFVLFELPEQLLHFLNYLSSVHSYMSFLFESEFNKKMYFVDVEICGQNGGFPANQRLLIWIALYYYI